MPFKHNASRRHYIPKARYRVTNWPASEAGLRAAKDFAEFLGSRGRAEEGFGILKKVYDLFDEGHESPEFVTTREMLHALGGPAS
jgi:hypothetical protein